MNGTARLAAGVLATAIAVTGCGSSGDTSVSSPARSELDALTVRVRDAAATFDRPGARRALAELRQAVAADVDRGDVSSARGAEILRAASGVEHQLALDVPPTAPTTIAPITAPTTASTPSDTSSPSPGSTKKGRKDKGRGDG